MHSPVRRLVITELARGAGRLTEVVVGGALSEVCLSISKLFLSMKPFLPQEFLYACDMNDKPGPPCVDVFKHVQAYPKFMQSKNGPNGNVEICLYLLLPPWMT
jgi:hypothetical protein